MKWNLIKFQLHYSLFKHFLIWCSPSYLNQWIYEYFAIRKFDFERLMVQYILRAIQFYDIVWIKRYLRKRSTSFTTARKGSRFFNWIFVNITHEMLLTTIHFSKEKINKKWLILNILSDINLFWKRKLLPKI